ncbi:hypothetical protein [Lutibacter sp.]|uniref:hypothetical protein n=1 Tax=Lutibacter sp. TaxID=1925666 RepID=UPI0035683BC6
MNTQKQTPNNGNAQKKVLTLKPTEEMKKTENATPKKEVKKEEIVKTAKISAEETKKQTETIIKSFAPSAEERIKNAENFKILTNKFAHLKTKSDELKRFKISSDGTKEKIYLENAEGFKFEVSNSKIIDETLNLLETTLNNILGETEEQVKNFVI